MKGEKRMPTLYFSHLRRLVYWSSDTKSIGGLNAQRPKPVKNRNALTSREKK